MLCPNTYKKLYMNSHLENMPGHICFPRRSVCNPATNTENNTETNEFA